MAARRADCRKPRLTQRWNSRCARQSAFRGFGPARRARGAFRMGIDRRRMFAALAGFGALGAASEARAAPVRDTAPRSELDAVSLGLRPNAPDNQSQILQR